MKNESQKGKSGYCSIVCSAASQKKFRSCPVPTVDELHVHRGVVT